MYLYYAVTKSCYLQSLKIFLFKKLYKSNFNKEAKDSLYLATASILRETHEFNQDVAFRRPQVRLSVEIVEFSTFL
jgi:hypothetical protein